MEHYPRLDFVSIKPLAENVEAELVRPEPIPSEFDVILVSDQAETEQAESYRAMREALWDLAQNHPGKVVWVELTKAAGIVSRRDRQPNEDEANAALARTNLRNYRELFQQSKDPCCW